MLRQALDALAGDAQPDATLREPDRGRVTRMPKWHADQNAIG